MTNLRSGYYKYEDYVYCQPYVDSEITKILESQSTEPTGPESDEIVKVESAEMDEEEDDCDEDEDLDVADFVDEPKHLKKQVGFWTRLWHRFLDGEPLFDRNTKFDYEALSRQEGYTQ